MKTKLVILPMPLTPLSILGFLIYEKMGFIGSGTHIRLTRTHVLSRTASTTINIANGYILDLTNTFLLKRELEKIQKPQYVKRLFSWIICGNEKLQKFSEWLTDASKNEHIDLVINQVKIMLSRYLNNEGDIWKEYGEIQYPSFSPVMNNDLSLHKEIRYLSLPKYQEGSIHKTETEVIGAFEVNFNECEILKLVNKGATIVVGGPSNSGKSTLVASLTEEINYILKSLKSRPTFYNLELTAISINLDLATPTLDAVLNGTANDRSALQQLKKSWSMEMAKESLETCIKNKKPGMILIGDLPGKVSEFSLVAAAGADVAVTITNDWEVMGEWKNLFRKVKIPLVAKIRSRLPEEGYQSAVTTYNPSELLSGRIIGLNRYKHSYDIFVQWLALFLLFDILPKMADDHIV